jgi:D-glycero-D-manno-heptose 1,7-bisphosphate phosphatase
MKRAVYLDRDGTLNVPILRDSRPYAPVTESDFRIYPEAEDALGLLKDAGLLTIVVTNQPELATGELTRKTLDRMHGVLMRSLPIDDIYVCPHHSREACDCHKPRPKMLFQAAEKWGVALGSSFLVGDRWRDIGAGNNAGCTTVLIERAYSGECEPDFKAPDLRNAIEVIIERL